MNGIEKITAHIQQDCQAEIDNLLAQARAKAAEITTSYQAKADAQAAEILAQGKKTADEQGSRLASVTQLECRKAVLCAKQEVIEEAFQRAKKKLLALAQEDYISLLANLAARASTSGREKLILSPADRARVGKAVVLAANAKLGAAAKLTLSEESRPMDGGFILSDGALEVNCTFDTLIRLQRETLAGAVSKVLFD